MEICHFETEQSRGLEQRGTARSRSKHGKAQCPTQKHSANVTKCTESFCECFCEMGVAVWRCILSFSLLMAILREKDCTKLAHRKDEHLKSGTLCLRRATKAKSAFGSSHAARGEGALVGALRPHSH